MDNYETLAVSRRRFFVTAGSIGIGGWLATRGTFGEWHWAEAAYAQDLTLVDKIRRAAATDPMSVERLRDSVSVVLGSGGNVVMLPGDDGVLLIDAGIVGPRVAASVATVSDAPIRHVINTHWHFDHTDANAWMSRNGAIIAAHENTRKHLEHRTRVADWEFTFPPAPQGALPTVVFSAGRAFDLNGCRVVAQYYGPAHTDSDVSVHFENTDVLHVGDTWWNGLYPFIDYSTGGGVDGLIRATNDNLSRISAETIVVPGHGPVGNKAQMTTYRDMLVAVRDRVAALKHQGRTVSEVIAAKPTEAFDAKWGGAIVDPAFFTRLVYKGV